MKGKVYTETVIYSAPLAFVQDAPYQIAIITLDDGRRVTGRIIGDLVSVDDAVSGDELATETSEFPCFRKANE